MKATVSDWNFIYVLKQRQFRKETTDSGLAIDLFTLKRENHAKAKACYDLVTLWLPQNILQNTAFFSYLFSLHPKNKQQFSTETYHWFYMLCFELYLNRMRTDNIYQFLVLNWNSFLKRLDLWIDYFGKIILFSPFIKMCNVRILIFICCRPTILSYLNALYVYSVLCSDTTTMKYKDELLLLLTNSQIYAKKVYYNSCQENPRLTQSLLLRFHFVVFWQALPFSLLEKSVFASWLIAGTS